MALVMFSLRLLMLLCEAEEAVTPVWGPRLLDKVIIVCIYLYLFQICYFQSGMYYHYLISSFLIIW